MIKYLSILIIGAGLLACSSVNTIMVDGDSVPVTDEYQKSNRIDSIVSPYRTELEKEMLEVIAFAPDNFTKGRPNGVLNNWSADALLSNQLRKRAEPRTVFSLLNVGGLRNPLSKGDINIGDVFKLMPFDNSIVWAEFPMEVLADIEDYLANSGGEPIGGAKVINGKIEFNNPIESSKTFWVITSDYLLTGGDNMDFFEKRVNEEYVNVLLRDVFLEEAEIQDTLIFNNEERVTF